MHAPMAPYVSAKPVREHPTHDDRLRTDARGWIGDARDLLEQGAFCTCTPGALQCELCEKLDFALDAIRACSGAAL